MAADLEDGETGTSRCIELLCEQLCEEAQKAAFVQGALEAGIPRAVIEGRVRLSDTSAKYAFMSASELAVEIAKGRAVKAGRDPEDI